MLAKFFRFRTSASILNRNAVILPVARCLGQVARHENQDVEEYFQYSKVIVSTSAALNPSFAKGALRFEEPREVIDINLAKQQHENYVRELNKLIPTLITVPGDEKYPDLVYVEDPAVVLDGTALITKMEPPTRAGEIHPMRKVLEEHLDLNIVEMNEPDAYLDGGDVMFTGREFLVGLSRRTNVAGVKSLAKAFPKWPVTCITVARPVLHLKSMCSIAGIDLIAISDSNAANIVWKEIEKKAYFKYEWLCFPDNNGANCLFINGVVLHPPKNEYPKSFKVWERLECPRVELPNSELAKADGSLTCNSIRIN